MSRVLSAAAIQAMFSSETDDTLITLLTIYSPTDSSVILRLADNFTKRITETDIEIAYGVTSRSNDYIFLPLEVTLPGESDDGVSNCGLKLNYVTPEAIQIIREQLTEPTKILLELVLASTPNTVEASFPGFYITSATYSAESIQLQLGMINYNTEPFPAYGFTPRYFPGLF
jgi:hypothetical protein